MGNDISGRRILSNIAWRFAESCGAQLVSFIVTVILSRILNPDMYGVVALVSVITSLLWIFIDSGLGNALIQKKDADDLDFSTVFYFNVGFCAILYFLLFFTAPLIARFYKLPELTSLIRVAGISLLLSSVKNVQQAYVAKNLLFKKFFFATLGGTIGAGIVGIVMAYLGYGAWALLVSTLFNATVDTLVLWCTVKWRPRRIFSWDRLRGLFSYGYKLLISSLLDGTFNYLYQFVIGKVYTTADLAFYNKGQQLPNLVINNVDNAINSVMLPVMSESQDEKEKIKMIAKRSLKTNFYTMSPLLVGMAVVSPALVNVVYTSKWIEAVPFIQIVCFIQIFRPIHTTNLNAIKAMGRSDLFLKLEVVKKAIGLLVLFIFMKKGVMALAMTLVIDCFTSQIINSWPSKKLFNYGYLEQLKDILPTIVLVFIMGAIVYSINFFNISDWLKLLIQVPLGALIYVGLSALFKLESFEYEIRLIKRMRKKND